jgi:hypothetical protein
MKAQKRGTKKQPWRNDAEKMKYKRIGTEDKKHSETWVRKTGQLHMDEVDQCKEDGCHMDCLF